MKSEDRIGKGAERKKLKAEAEFHNQRKIPFSLVFINN